MHHYMREFAEMQNAHRADKCQAHEYNVAMLRDDLIANEIKIRVIVRVIFTSPPLIRPPLIRPASPLIRPVLIRL